MPWKLKFAVRPASSKVLFSCSHSSINHELTNLPVYRAATNDKSIHSKLHQQPFTGGRKIMNDFWFSPIAVVKNQLAV